MIFLLLAVMIVALVWTVYDKLFGKPKPTLGEWKARLEGQEWYSELMENPKYVELVEHHRGVRSYLKDTYQLQRLIENEDVRKGFVRYLEREAGR
jgi:hypothetical protein